MRSFKFVYGNIIYCEIREKKKNEIKKNRNKRIMSVRKYENMKI